MQEYKRILIIDNYDSFTYNLVDYFKRLNCEVEVFRNTIDPETLSNKSFDLLVLSPGPSVPKNAGNLFKIIELFYNTKPILGVCLGLQALVEFFGGSLKHVEPMHGKIDKVIHDQQSIFTGLTPNIEVARYHSLAVDNVPNNLVVSSRSQDGTIMSVRHKFLPIEGIQFHPESILSMKDDVGMKIIKNVIAGKISTGNVGYLNLMKVLQNGAFLQREDIEGFIENIAENQLTEDQKLVLLVSFSYKLKNPYYLNEFIEVLSEYGTIKDAHNLGMQALDVCGTGGSGLPRINTSTLAALALAALNVPILKHGNKAASGRFGSFNLLEELQIPIKYSKILNKRAFEKTNLSFIYAPDVHPIIGHFANSRARIGVPSIFNVLGPLLNPFNPKRQFIGTAFKEYMDLIFETAILMGKEHVVVARGHDGLDEISISAPTHVKIFKNGQKEYMDIHPEDFGIETVPFSKLKSNSPQESLEIAEKIMDGVLDTEHYKLIAANAAFIYAQFEEDMSLPEAYNKIVKLLRSGRLRKKLNDYKHIFNGKTHGKKRLTKSHH
ncbi:MAG: anthranilate phosphoribosyltransferase [Bacteroidetes bacterium]|nr:anthranilate phosphoribosyltransferase [Bacteroidota bacterium]